MGSSPQAVGTQTGKTNTENTRMPKARIMHSASENNNDITYHSLNASNADVMSTHSKQAHVLIEIPHGGDTPEERQSCTSNTFRLTYVAHSLFPPRVEV